MGVQGLIKTITRFSPASLKWLPLASLQGLSLAVDTSTYLVRALTQPTQKRLRSNTLQVLNECQRGAHVTGLHVFAVMLLKWNVRPLFVFDYYNLDFTKDGESGRSSSVYKVYTTEKRQAAYDKQMNILRQGLNELHLLEVVVDKLQTLRASPHKEIKTRFFERLGQVLQSRSTGNPTSSRPSPLSIGSQEEFLQHQIDYQSQIDPSCTAMVTFGNYASISDTQMPQTPTKSMLLESHSHFETSAVAMLIDQQLEIKEHGDGSGLDAMVAIENLLDAFPSTVGHVSLMHIAKKGKLRLPEIQSLQKAISEKKKELLPLQFRTCRLNGDRISDVMRLLDAMDLPYTMASNPDIEAEFACTSFANDGYVDAVLTEDTDAIVTSDVPIYTKFLRRPISYGHGKSSNFGPVGVLRIDPVRVRRDLGLTKEQFMDFAILCGCDYSPSLPGIGPIKALAMIQTFKSIESVLASLSAIGLKATMELCKSSSVMKQGNIEELDDILADERNEEEDEDHLSPLRISASRSKKASKIVKKATPFSSLSPEIDLMSIPAGAPYEIPENFDFLSARMAFSQTQVLPSHLTKVLQNSETYQRRLHIQRVWPVDQKQTTLEQMLKEFERYERNIVLTGEDGSEDDELAEYAQQQREDFSFVKRQQYH